MTEGDPTRNIRSHDLVEGPGSGGHAGVGFAQRRAGDPLRDPGLVEVLRDPAEEERVAGAEDEAGVDVGGRLDDAFVEQGANLVGDRFERVLADLVARAPRV